MAGRIPKNFISTLLERIDIIDVINQRVTLKQKGTNYSACCPFHNEKTPSFSVSQTKQFYHCFGCGVSGDAIAFLMEYERLSFVEAIEQLAKFVGLDVPYEDGVKPTELQIQATMFELMQTIANYYQLQLKNSVMAKTYLTNRGLSTDIIEKYLLGYAPETWHQIEKACGNNPGHRSLLIEAGMLIPKENTQPYDRFRQRIMFPIRNRRGHIIGFGGRSLGEENPKYLNSPETQLFRKGHELYGLFEAQAAIRDAKQIIVVEGYMDVIALAQFNIPNAVATLGTAATSEHIKLLLKYAPQIIFCFDGDNAGRNAAWRALENSLAFVHEGVNFSFCFLPNNEDPDSYLRRYDKDQFLNLIQSALSLSEFLMQNLAQGLDLATIDGKNQLCQKAKPLLLKVTSGVYRQLLLQQLAKIIRLDETTLQQLIGIPVTHNTVKMRTQKVQMQSSPSPIRTVITLLLQHPNLISYVQLPAHFDTLAIPGKELLLELIELIQTRPHINTAAILQQFSEHPQILTLKKLASKELFYVEGGLTQELTDSIKQLQKTCRELEMEQLLTKAHLTGLTQDDRIRLQSLIGEQHKT